MATYEDGGQDESLQEYSLVGSCTSPPLHSSPPEVTGLNPAYAHCLLYYTVRLSRLLVMVDTPSNPLRDMVIPRMASSPMLLRAVCAVSACHLAQQRQDGSSRDENGPTATVVPSGDGTFGLRNYAQALSSLTRCLAGYARADRSSVDQIVLTAVFLCKYEIIRGSTREWRHHLAGLTQLMRHPVTVSGLSHEARKYLQSLYVCKGGPQMLVESSLV